ncbi:hypothetical protein [Streptomyces sp. NBC_01233]|uniref:hypothetical protein n=1 Tax=Streptomyces sp. NBC_01233 TaxID=2903787 RepID=UPI002E0D5B31|nr:hypothetical protein OG332_07550 [Streptomyces sp. NBC_01233]
MSEADSTSDATSRMWWISGRAISTGPRRTALWTARIRDGQVVEWRVHEDTPDVRKELAVQEGR